MFMEKPVSNVKQLLLPQCHNANQKPKEEISELRDNQKNLSRGMIMFNKNN